MKRIPILTPLLLILLVPMGWQEVAAAEGRLQQRATQHRAPQHRPVQHKPVQPKAVRQHTAPRQVNRESVKFKEGWGNVRARDKATRPVHSSDRQLHVQNRHVDGNQIKNRHIDDHRKFDNSRDIHGNNVVINNRHNHIVVPPNRRRVYHDVVVVRPYGHWYGGYGSYYDDNDAWKWLAFTAITLKLLDNLNEAQQREHESAQVRATTAPLNDPITWSDGNANGSVTAVREGTSNNGRYCREFQQTVNVGGKKEDAFGTACQNADGSWEIVSD